MITQDPTADRLAAELDAQEARLDGLRGQAKGKGRNGRSRRLSAKREHARMTRATRGPPHFLPDEVDGRHLRAGGAPYKAIQEGRTPDPTRGLGDVVMVPSVRGAQTRRAVEAGPMFTRFTAGRSTIAELRNRIPIVAAATLSTTLA